jgi:hypothetical protein
MTETGSLDDLRHRRLARQRSVALGGSFVEPPL